MQLTEQDDQGDILMLVADAVDTIGPCSAEGIFLDQRWQVRRFRGDGPNPAEFASSHAGDGVFARLPGMAWSWAYPIPVRRGGSGWLVVGAAHEPTESERFLLQVLAQQAGIALASARLRGRERAQAGELAAANLALQRSIEIHDRLTQVALSGHGAGRNRQGRVRADRSPDLDRGPFRQPSRLGGTGSPVPLSQGSA